MPNSRLLLAVVVFAQLVLVQAVARAQCGDSACVHAGTTLATVTSSQSEVLDRTLTSLTGATVDLTVANHQTLAAGNVRLDTLLGALQAQGVAGTPTDAAQANITLNQLYTASASALRTQGDTVNAAVFDTLAAQVANVPTTVKVGDLVKFDSRPQTLATSQLNLLDFVSGSASLLNGNNLLAVNDVTVSGSAIGLTGFADTVTLAVKVLEPAVFVCGSQGAQFYSAGVRIRAKVDLVDTTTPLNVAGLASASLTLASLDLVAEVARGTGTIQSVNVATNAVTIQATPGLAALYLGEVSNAVLAKTSPINTTTELLPATIARVDVRTILGVNIQATVSAKAWANGSAVTPTTLSFTGPYPQTRTAVTQAGFATTLVTTLLSNLTVTVDTSGLLGTLLGSLLNPLLSAVTSTLANTSTGVLAPALNGVVSGVLNPLLNGLGVRLGEMDVTVDKVYRVPAGAACEDGLFCSVSDTCNGSGACVGSARVCNDNLSCTADSCNEATRACVAPVTNGCLIGGACYANGAQDPGNACRACNPAVSTTAFTVRPSGTACDDGLFCTENDQCNLLGVCLGGSVKTCSDGLACTIDVCNELTDACDISVSTGCLIGGGCVGQGALRPLFPCQVCDSSQSLIGWSNRATGTTCDDGLFCTTGDPCNPLGLCGGAPNTCSDGIGCTADVCNELNDSCASTFVGGCVIDGACQLAGATDPANPCRLCNPLVSTTTWTNKGAGASCDDGQFCTVGDACNGSGACISTPRNCNDALGCTSDSCNEATDTCANDITSGCVIAGTCVGSGVLNVLSPCQICDPAQLLTGWANRPAGTTCDDGQFCTVDDKCSLGSCMGTARDCSDGVACTADSCNEAADRCTNTSTGCVIDGACIPAGADDPANPCRACNPAISTSSWTNKGAGVACDDEKFCTTGDQCNGAGTCTSTPRSCADNLSCTNDSCDEASDQCVNALTGGCAIGGACIPAGAANPASQCQVCDPSQSTSAWTNKAAGTSCDDGQYCTDTDACNAGACVGTPRVCNDNVACTFDSCDEQANQCKFEAAGCVIDGICRATGADDPGNPCRACVPTVSTSVWTNKAAATVCDDGQYCTVNDACNGQGQCTASARDCNDNLSCTADSCNETNKACVNNVNAGCLIAGSCVTAGGANPDAPCQLCDASRSTTAWSARPSGTLCDDGQFCTQGDQCNDSGACVSGSGSACASDGLACTNEVCNEQSDSCNSVLGAGCIIAGACVAERAKNPSDACQLCAAASSTSQWTTDYTSCDSDGDGLYDASERVNDKDIDTDGDGLVDRLDADDDNDSVPTREENADPNNNGRPDDARDFDDDRKPDYLDSDDDGDGRSTKREVDDAKVWEEDTDDDGEPNWYDFDSDDDGLLDVTENETYPDPTPPARPAYLDESVPGIDHPDTDKDGLLDEVECPAALEFCPDTDGDQFPDWNDPDDDGDHVNTRYERPNGVGIDTDGDTIPNWQDADDDGDSLDTRDEEPDFNGDFNPRDAQDFDGDGVPDYLDTDDDDDTILTKTERADAISYGSDVDRDSIPNWYDLDSDGDTILDADEPGDLLPPLGPDYLQAFVIAQDGGVDAGGDASLPDAGVDAGPRDAGARDAAEDADSVDADLDDDAAVDDDAGQTDAGRADAGRRLPPGGAAGGGLCKLSDGSFGNEVWTWLLAALALTLGTRRRRGALAAR